MHQFIAGSRRRGGSGETFDVTDPATGQTVEQVALAGPADVDAAVAAARAAFPDWSGAPPVERSAALPARRAPRRARRGPRRIETRQAGKPIRLTTGFDVPGTIDNTAFFAGAARNLEGKAAGEYSGDHTSYVRREADRRRRLDRARGTTRCRWPPGRSCPAVAAGNTIVLKPAEITPLTSLMLAEAAPRRASRTAWSTSSPAPGRWPARRWSRTPTSPWCPSPGRTAVGRRVMELAPRTASSACTSSSAARRRSWSSTTPTSRPPCTARSPAR